MKICVIIPPYANMYGGIIVHFQFIDIENFKAIDRMHIIFRPGIDLLIGDNGVGKTAILEALIVALGGFFSGVKGVSSQGILQTDVRFKKVSLAGASSSILHFHPTLVSANLCFGEGIFTCSRLRTDVTGASKTRTNAKELSRYVAQLVNDPWSSLPLLSYHSTARVTQFRREDFGTASKNKLDDRRCGYIGCLDGSKDIKSIREWCLKMEMAEYHKGRKIPEYETFKDVVATVMHKMSESDEKPQVYYSREFEDLVYSENGSEIPVKYLSAGYQSLLWMVMDMAFRLALLNPGCNDMSFATGIVLIDEIDMHLHPKWQWNVLGTLKKVFPKMQFIIATHSPIIISSCKDGHLIRIDEWGQISYLQNAYAFSMKA